MRSFVHGQVFSAPSVFVKKLGRSVYEYSNDFLSRQREQAIVFLPIPLALGILIYFALPDEPALSTGLVPALVSLFGIVSLGRIRFENKGAYVQWLCLVCVFLVSLGFTAAKLETLRLDAPVLKEKLKFANITGNIEYLELLPEKGAKIILTDLSIEELKPDQTPHSVRVKIWDPSGLTIGQRVSFLGQLTPPSAPVSPGGFDFQRYAFFQQIGAFGFGYKTPEILSDTQMPFMTGFRQDVQNKAREVLPSSQAGIVTALLTGIRGGIPEEDQENLRHAGLAHLLAISGLHVGLVAGFIFFVVRLGLAAIPYLALNWPIKKIAAVAGLAAAIFYTIFVGAPVPTQRALIMTSIVLFAIMIDRSPFSMRLVAVAALCVLLIQPSSLLGASFQLSFAAVIALIAFYEVNRGRLYAMRRGNTLWHVFLTYVIGIVLTSIIATIGTAPFSLYHFQQFAVYSLIGNVLAMPIMVFWVMPAAVMSVLVWPLGLAEWPLMVMGEGVGWITAAAAYVSDLPGAIWRVPQWPLATLALLAAGGLWLCLIQGRERAFGGIFIVIGLSLSVLHIPPDIKVSENSKLAAIRMPDQGLVFSSRRKERFVREVWTRQNAQSPDQKMIFKDEGSGFSCDSLACRTTVNGRKLSHVHQPYALAEECVWADIVLSQVPVFDESCRKQAYVIDRFDVWRNGAYALTFLDNNRIKTQTVEYERGNRPWIHKRQ